MNPFPGLRPFLEEEAHLFFGREQQVGSMVARLARTHFLTVVGTSGCGKSSLVNCGLVPALHAGEMPGAGPVWQVARFRPGNDPIGAMSRALAAEGVLYTDAPDGVFSLVEIVESTLRMSRLGLMDVWEQAHRPPDENLLVIVDQFEELFRFHAVGAPDGPKCYELGDDATAFVNLLLEVRAHLSVPIYVVLTMRSDFLGDTAQLAGLPEAINDGQYLVPRMTRDERKRAIEGPVRAVGASMSPVLLTRLVNDVGDNADQLSILQHALNRTWAQWGKDGTKGELDLPQYTAIGTMALALDRHAERAYSELTTERDWVICANLFKALTDKATDSRGVRRPTTVATLCGLTAASVQDLERVMAVFRKPSRSFLMPPQGEALLPDTVVDISHESLMRVWERLRVWSDEEAQSALAYRRLAETARLHAADKADLWRGRDLEGATLWRDTTDPTQLWAERYAPGFTAAMEFLDKCVAADAAEKRQEAEAARRAADVEQKMARTQRRYRTAVITATVVVAALIGIALQLSFVNRVNQKEIEAARLKEKASAQEAAAQQALARARTREVRANVLESTVSKQIATGVLLEGAREAVQEYSVNPTETLRPPEVANRFSALTRASAIAESTPATERSGITIEYFRKPSDAGDLSATFKQLGFKVQPKPMRNPNVTNSIWYSSDVPEDSVKLVAYALIRAGYDLVGIQPLGDRPGRTRIMQVGHNVGLETETPFTAEMIGATSLAALYRVEARERANVRGVIAEVDANGTSGMISTPDGSVTFRLVPGAAPLQVGQLVGFTLFSTRDGKKYGLGVRELTIPASAMAN
jgi:energy-coupling factor transporter ATP-binding protein EcfA2